MGKTIGVISLKGGVGKTSVVVSLGASFAGFGKKVLIVDGNLSSPNLNFHLNLAEPSANLHQVLNREINSSNAVCNFDNFDIIPASMFDNFITNPLKLKDRLKYLKRKYDIILLDSSPAMNEETLAVMLASDEILVVTTPDIPTLSSTIKSLKIARQRGTPIIGLVINKVYKKNFELSPKDIEDTAGVPVMAVIPYDINFMKSLSQFTPYPEYATRSEGSEEYRRLAATLIGERYKPVKFKKFFMWVIPKKQDINREIYYQSLFG